MTQLNIYQLLDVLHQDLIVNVHQGDQQVFQVPKTILIIWFQKENLKSKARKFQLGKGLFFWVTLIQAVVSKTHRLFSKYISVYKILCFKKQKYFNLDNLLIYKHIM